MIAAVVVTFSAPAGMLERCIEALRDSGGVDRIIVVDTGGRAAGVGDDVRLLSMPNRGYGAAANLGIRVAIDAGADAVALLNDDVVVRPGWTGPLIDELAPDDVGAAQPKLLFADEDPPIVNSLGVVIGPDGAGTDVGRGSPDDADAPADDLGIFTGGAVMIAPAFFDATGGFDERYFLYYEDVDLARRGRRLGWRYRLVPASVVDHAVGASTGDLPDRTRFLQERNRLWTAVRFGTAGVVARAVWLSVRRLRHRPRRVHARALAAGAAGAPRRLWERAAAARQRP